MKSFSGRAKVVGTVFCIGGAIVLTLYEGKPLTNPNHLIEQSNITNSRNKTERWTIGSIFLIAGCVGWASWFLMQAKIGKRYPCQYSSTAILSCFAAIQSAMLSIIIERNLSGWFLKGYLEITSIVYAVSILFTTQIPRTT